MLKYLVGVAALALATSGSAAAPLDQETGWIAAQGQTATLPSNLSGYLGLTDGKTPYPIKGLQWSDDNDNSTHWCEMSATGDRYMIIAYAPPDKSYAINWLTDSSGKLYLTVYGAKSGMRVVPNDKFEANFAAELSYWNTITAANYHPPAVP